MISESTDPLMSLKKEIAREKKIIGEISSLKSNKEKVSSSGEKRMIDSQISSLKKSFESTDRNIRRILEGIMVKNYLPKSSSMPIMRITQPKKEKKSLIFQRRSLRFLCQKWFLKDSCFFVF